MKSPVLFSFLLLGVCAIVVAQQPEIPELRRYVTDLTGTLSSDEVGLLEQTLRQFERETSNQIVVLMLSTVGEESIEEYAIRVAEKNRIGKKGRDNGVLLLIAKDDRQMRIEVGYGLEGTLPDAIADQIIRHEITPRFRDGDYDGGVRAGVDAIMAATKGEYKGEPDRDEVKKFSPFAIIVLILIFLIFGRIFGGGRRSSIGSGRYHSSWPWWSGGFGGGGFGGGSWGGFGGGGGSFGGGGASGRW